MDDWRKRAAATSPGRRRGLAAALASLATAGALAGPGEAAAYTAAGDRSFPATIVLPQIAPSDEIYLTPSTQPLRATTPGAADRQTNLDVTYDKTITDRWGLSLEDGYSWLHRLGAPTQNGAPNLQATVQYLMLDNQPHEFLLSAGVTREFGDTGARRAGADESGATTPAIFFGKGLGDLDIGYLRPLAVTGTFGFQAADPGGRASLWQGGIAIEYSLPYLESKVQAVALPDFLRSVTPIVEMFFATPTRSGHGAATTGVVAPGFNYAGEGWDFGLEALVPTTHAAGSGVGVAAQFHLSLDFLFPDSIGRPLF